MKFKTIDFISSLHGDLSKRKSLFNHIKSKRIGFALDSNVFREKDFLKFLSVKKEEIQFFLPSIVQIEVGYFYRSKGKIWEDFCSSIQNFDCILLSNNIFKAPELIDFAFKHKQNLPLREHFRDYMIGLECNLVEIPLITENIRHFQVFKNDVVTMKDFVLKYPIMEPDE